MSLSANFPTVAPSLTLDFANTKQLDPRITFTRATTATYYDGVTTAKAEENLLLQSQTFDNASWSKSLVTVTANSTTAPDGTATADSIVENSTTTDFYWVSQSVTKAATATTYTFSVFALQSARTWAMLTVYDGAAVGNRFWFNLATGAVGTSATIGAGFTSTSYTSTASTNGFYRITCTFTTNTATTLQCFIHPASGDGNQTMTGVVGQTGIIIWGAQLEQRSSVSSYTVTTTQPITNYIPVLLTAGSGVPRFDCNPTTGVSLGLLIEEQRTNLLTYSADFSNAAWNNSNLTLTANTIVAPDGTLTGDKVAANTGSSLKAVLRASAASITAGTVYTASAYVKNSGVQYVSFTFDDNATTNGVTTTFDLTNGTISRAAVAYGTGASAASSITAVGNSWYRITITGTAGTTSVLGRWAISIQSSGTTQFNNYTGNGFDGIFVWGAQLEAGAFPTSYIATTTTTVQRNNDAASMTGTNFSSWFNASEGTVLVLARTIDYNSAVFPRIYALSLASDTANNFIQTFINGSADSVGFEVRRLGSFEVSATLKTSYTGAFIKFANAYKVNDFAGVADAGTVQTDTAGSLPSLDTLYIGNLGSGAYMQGTISKISYYPLRLTNAQLQALTGS